MTPIATLLLIIAACTHAGWNFISKKGYPSQAFYLVANSIGVICILPILLYRASFLSFVPSSVFIIVVMSGFFLAAYLKALAGAYGAGDISIAYPLARSLPVVLVFLISSVLGKGESTGAWFIFGMALIVSGCIILPLKTWADFHFSNYFNRCCLLAVLAAVGTASYTIADDMALRLLRELPGKPLSLINGTLIYMVLEGISCSLWQGLFVAVNRRERQNLSIILTSYKGPAVITGLGIYLTYGIVLVSMNHVDNVSYVAAFRQLSIPLGAILGMTFLKESRYPPKYVGIGAMFLGLVLAAVS